MNVFSRIYQHNEWNGIETRSGPGSHREPTRRVADAILDLSHWLGVFAVLNVGCGEDNWFPNIPGAHIVGMDIAPEAIEEAQRRNPDRDYIEGDARDGVMRTDLIVCRDMIQHLSVYDAALVLVAFKESRSRYLLASTYVGAVNEDIETGGAYRPNLEAEPFNLPPALLLLHDGYEYHDGDRLRDPAKMLGLWGL